MDKTNLLQLLKIAATADKTSPVAYSFGEEKFTYSQIDAAVRKEMDALAGNHNLYRKNKALLFELIEETIDEVLPKKVLEQYGQFAEVKTISQGDKAVFYQNITEESRTRAKTYVTKVGLAGVYEIFKLDGRALKLETMAYGGAAQIGIEEFLDGRITFADIVDIVLLALDEAVYREIALALVTAVDQLPNANTVVANGFVADNMDRLVAIADAYGQATIYCTYEFATTMVPAEGWISDDMRNAVWAQGYLANYKGHRVIVLPQSFEDATHEVKVIDPAYAFIIPAGGNDKPVKIAFEGQTVAKEFENRDFSTEIHIYKKLGVGTLMSGNICVYKNTALTRAVSTEDIDLGS